MTPNSCPMVTRVAHPLQVACSRWPPLCIPTTYRLLVLLYAYVPPTCAPLCKDKRVCQSIETSAHAFSICTCRPLMTLRLVRLPNLPAPILRERLLSTKDPKRASNVYQSVLVSTSTRSAGRELKNAQILRRRERKRDTDKKMKVE